MLNAPELSLCPDCGSPVELDTHRAETVCTGCSIVVEHSLIESQRSVGHWDEGEAPQQSGGPALSPAKSRSAELMTVIRGYRDARGTTLNHDQLTRSFRMARQQRQVKGRGQGRSLQDMDRHIVEVGQRLSLHRDVIARAKVLAREVRRESGFKGQPFEILAAVTLLLAARERGQPLAARDIVNVMVTKNKKTKCRILRLFRMYRSKLGLSSVQLLRPEQAVPRICSELSLPTEVQTLAINLLQSVNIQSRSPWTMAAGAVYLACQPMSQRRTEKAVSRASGCSEVSLRTAYRSLLPMLGSVMNAVALKRLEKDLPQ